MITQSVVQIETIVNIFLKFKLNHISTADNRQLLMALNLLAYGVNRSGHYASDNDVMVLLQIRIRKRGMDHADPGVECVH